MRRRILPRNSRENHLGTGLRSWQGVFSALTLVQGSLLVLGSLVEKPPPAARALRRGAGVAAACTGGARRDHGASEWL
jgi:hypothetical protein